MGTIEINPVYAELLPYFHDDTVRYIVIYGGRRSGKSWAVSDILTYIAADQSNTFIPAIRKYGTSLKDSVFQRFANSIASAELPCQKNKTDKEFTLPNKSRIRCFGLDDPEKLKSLEDPKYVWFEEATENEEQDFDTVDAGLSPQGISPKIILTFNPVPQIPGSLHWIQRRFLYFEHKLSVVTKHENIVVLRTWYNDNKKCPETTKKLLEGYKNTNIDLYKMWALGEFTTLEGVIFNNWDIVEKVPDGIELSGYGLDFGFSNDPAAAVRIWVHNNEIWIEGLVYKTDLTNDDLYTELKEYGIGDYDLIVADSAEPKSIEQLKRRGFRRIIPVKKRSNYKEEMVNELKAYKIHLLDKNLDLQREFSTYSWARDKNNKQLPKVQDGNDHYIDAVIMFMHNLRHSIVMQTPTISIY